jgi:hypothetical protein
VTEREKNYNEIAAAIGWGDPTPEMRQSLEAWETHLRIIRVLDGREPDPRKDAA